MAYGEADEATATPLSNVKAAQIIGTDQLKTGGYNLTGRDQVIGMWEPGAPRKNHQEFQTLSRMNWADDSLRYQIYGKREDTHATHVGGTMIGEGVIGRAEGMATRAEVDAYTTSDDNDGRTEYVEMLRAAGRATRTIELSNHSYGPPLGWVNADTTWVWKGDPSVNRDEDWHFGFYNVRAEAFDHTAYTEPYYLIVKAAGNDRNDAPPSQPVPHHIGSPSGRYVTGVRRDDDCDSYGGRSGYDCIGGAGVAKNVVTIDALEDDGVTPTDFTAFGPTDDGRIKPDLMANGRTLYSAAAYDDQKNPQPSTADYDTLSGTSMAAPTVTGTVALLREYNDQTSPSLNPRFLFSTYRALLIGTADDLTAGPATVGPDYATGWGRVDAAQAADVIYEESQTPGGGPLHINEDTLTTSQDTVAFEFTVDSQKDVRVTMAWTDPPGTPPNTKQLDPTREMFENDLDMRVYRLTDGNYWEPYTLDPYSPRRRAGNGDNDTDNVEQIRLTAYTNDTYRVVATAAAGSGSNQAVSFVVVDNDTFTLTDAGAPSGGDPVGGTNTGDVVIAESQTWTEDRQFTSTESGPHSLRIMPDVELKIYPGVTLEFGESFNVVVEEGGHLFVNGGSPTGDIVFKATSGAEFWRGIVVKGDKSHLVNARVEDVGYGPEFDDVAPAALRVEAQDFEVVFSTLDGGSGYGIRASNAGVTLYDVSISNYEEGGIYLTKGTLSISGSTISDNGKRGIDTGDTSADREQNEIYIENTDIERNSLYGIIAKVRTATITGSSFANNGMSGLSLSALPEYDGSTQVDSITVLNSDFVGNYLDGAVIHHADQAEMRSNEFSENGRIGAYIDHSNVDIFKGNTIEENGSDGLFHRQNGYLYANDHSNNRIRNNGEHEIRTTTYTYLGDATYDEGGYNEIYDTGGYGSGNFYVYQATSYLDVSAEMNDWGEAPVPGMFKGPVDYEPYVTEPLSASVFCGPDDGSGTVNCTASASGGGGSYSYDWNQYGCDGSSSCTASCGGSYVSVAVASASGETATPSTTTSECLGGGGDCGTQFVCTASTSEPYATLDEHALQREIDATESSLQSDGGTTTATGPTSTQAGETDATGNSSGGKTWVTGATPAQKLERLYSLLLLKTRVEQVRGGNPGARLNAFSGSRSEARSVFARFTEAGPTKQTGRRPADKARDAARQILVENLLRRTRPGRALQSARQYVAGMATPEGRAQMHLQRARAFEQQGKFKQALRAVDTAEKQWPEGDYMYIRLALPRQSGDPRWRDLVKKTVEGRSEVASPSSAAKTRNQQVEKDLPQEFALESPYPNPTSGRVTVPLALPARADVRAAVYDVLGRRVKTLAARSLAAGHPDLSIPTEELSSGLYLLRVKIRPATGEARTFSETVTVIR